MGFGIRHLLRAVAVGVFGGALAQSDECSASSASAAGFEYQVTPEDGFTLSWTVDTDTQEITVEAVYQGSGWLAIGWSDSGRMPGADAVIGLPSAETVLEYDMPDYSTPSASAVQEISDATIAQAGGVTTLKFVRPLEPLGDGKQLLSVSETANWLYAWGGSNNFVRHSMDGAFSLALDSCSIGSVTGVARAEYVHGWLMVLGWTLCFPMGILFARFSSSFKDLGFPAHRVLQSLGSLLVIAGFVVSVKFTEDEGLQHFKETHQMNGLILTVFVGLQVVAAALRPSKPPAGAMVQDATGQTKPQPVSKVRRAWALLHRVLGYIAVVMAVFQCFGGLRLVDAEDAWRLVYLLLVVVMATAFVVLQALACCRAKRDTPSDNSGPQQGGAVVALGTR